MLLTTVCLKVKKKSRKKVKKKPKKNQKKNRVFHEKRYVRLMVMAATSPTQTFEETTHLS